MSSQVDIINSFAYLGLRGQIVLHEPELEVGIFEEHPAPRCGPPRKDSHSQSILSVWVGQKVGPLGTIQLES